jgi:hypothetical protein
LVFWNHGARVPEVVVSFCSVFDVDPSHVFAVFDRQDSGCVSYGVDHEGQRLFVKKALTAHGRHSPPQVPEFPFVPIAAVPAAVLPCGWFVTRRRDLELSES